jgi:hypothetical protein
MKDWHYVIQGQVEGPIPENDLIKMIQSGELSTDTLVWNGDPGNAERGWVKITETELIDISKKDKVTKLPPPPPPIQTVTNIIKPANTNSSFLLSGNNQDVYTRVNVEKSNGGKKVLLIASFVFLALLIIGGVTAFKAYSNYQETQRAKRAEQERIVAERLKEAEEEKRRREDELKKQAEIEKSAYQKRQEEELRLRQVRLAREAEEAKMRAKAVEEERVRTQAAIAAREAEIAREKSQLENKLKQMSQEQERLKKYRNLYKSNIFYSQLARTPEKYIESKISLKGYVLQVTEGSTLITIRLATSGKYDNVVMASFDPSILKKRILEDDYIKIYGISKGIYTYTTVLGASMSIPYIETYIIDS